MSPRLFNLFDRSMAVFLLSLGVMVAGATAILGV